MSGGAGTYLELKSERVQRELAVLPGWKANEQGLEATFQFHDGAQALGFLRQLGDLLDDHPQPPRRLALTGAVLNIALGEDAAPGIATGDLALAARIAQLRSGAEAAPDETAGTPSAPPPRAIPIGKGAGAGGWVGLLLSLQATSVKRSSRVIPGSFRIASNLPALLNKLRSNSSRLLQAPHRS